MDFSGKKVLLLGNGWLGNQLYNALRELSKTQEVTVVLSGGNQRYLEFDDYSFIADLKDEYDLAISTIPLKFLSANNVRGLNELPVGHWVWMSSTGVYPPGQWAEDGDVVKDHPYFQGEEALRSELDNLSICRLAGLIGGERNPGRFFKKGVIPNGQNAVNLIHGQDIVELILKHLDTIINNRVLNFVNPTHPKKGDYYQRMASKQGSSLTVAPTNAPNKIINSKLFNQSNFEFTNLDEL